MNEILFDLVFMLLSLAWTIEAHLDGSTVFKWIQAVGFGLWVHWVVADSVAYFQLLP